MTSRREEKYNSGMGVEAGEQARGALPGHAQRQPDRNENGKRGIKDPAPPKLGWNRGFAQKGPAPIGVDDSRLHPSPRSA